MHVLGVYIRDNLPIFRELSLKAHDYYFMCFRLSLINLCYLSLFPLSPSLRSFEDCSILVIITDSIEKALFLHPPANIFVFGDFNSNHDTWLKQSKRTDVASIQTFIFHCPIPTQILDFSTHFPSKTE